MTVGGILFRDDANREIGVPGTREARNLSVSQALALDDFDDF